jgi:hypothetical protein
MIGKKLMDKKVGEPIANAMIVALTALALAFVAIMIAVAK